jgi:glycerophosphoryl diester phosphodiesterase
VAPLVIAHRGASAAAPENTLEAFRLAARLGADGTELDVRRTADGAMCIHHDAHLADGRLIVSLAAADLPASVPDLDAALGACTGVVNVEIKNHPRDPDFDPTYALARQVVDCVRARGDGDRVIVSCFDLATIDRVHALDPDLATGWLTFPLPDPEGTVATAAAHGHRALHPFVGTVDANLVAVAQAAGLQVNPWTVDDPAVIRDLARLGVDAVITNVPDVARAALTSLASLGEDEA